MKLPTHSTTEQNNNTLEALKNPGLFQKKYSLRYYLATRLLPKRVRGSVELLYAFVRIPDEIIDTEYKDDLARGLFALSEFETEWEQVWAGTPTNNEFLSRCHTLFKKHAIPFEYSLDFLKAMKQDATVSRYDTYKELEMYMYGSAGVVGYMLSNIFGYKDGALPHAKSLAYAMQMTNFLRDIDEDYVKRNRIYLPQEDMHQFNITDAEIRARNFSPAFKELMKYKVTKTQKLYTHGYEGIHLLSIDTRLAVFVSGKMYERVLERIVRNDYNPFVWKSDTGAHKVYYLISAIIEYQFRYIKKYTHAK